MVDIQIDQRLESFARQRPIVLDWWPFRIACRMTRWCTVGSLWMATFEVVAKEKANCDFGLDRLPFES